jgi:hypothetical protein
VADRRGDVLAGLRALDGLAEGESVFGVGPGFWAGGKQIAHIVDEGPDGSLLLEVRLTRRPSGTGGPSCGPTPG